MKTIACLLSLLISIEVLADPIVDGNKCWDEKKYQCVVDNYRQALSNRQYKEQDYSTIQYRIGHSLGKLGRHSEGITALREALRTRAGYPSATWEMAWLLYSIGKYDSAANYYTLAIPLYKESQNLFKLHYWKGQSLAGAKKYKDAIVSYKEALRIDSTDVYAVAGIGDASINSYNYKEAFTYYTKALTLAPKDDTKLLTSITYWRGKSNYYLAKYADALTDFRKTLSYDPAYKLAIWDMAAVYYDQKKWAEAEAQYGKTIPFYKDDKISQRNLYYYRALCREKQNNLTGALADYDMSLQIDPRYVSAIWAKAEIFRKQNRTKDIITLYTKAIADDSLAMSRAMLYYKRGEIYLKQKDTVTAEKDFKKSLDEDMYLGEPNMALGHLEFAKGRYITSSDYYDAALDDFTFFPDSTEMGLAYYRKGIGNLLTGSFQEAEDDLGTAINYDPKNGGPRRYLGELYYNRKNYTKAADEFTKAISLYKNEKDSLHKVHYYRGLTYTEMRKYPEALADYTEALRLKPNETTYLFRTGQMQFELKDYTKARDNFTKLAGLLGSGKKDDLALTYYCRGRCWFELNDKVRAKADFTKALEYAPGYTECRQWLDKVQ